MKKILGITIVLMLAAICAKAQDYEALNRFMEKYSQNWTIGYRVEKEQEPGFKMIEQVGLPMPSFHFDKQLNSKALKGKFVVLNFWATWCGGCRILSCDLDTVLFRDMTPYKGVQVIGVDANEKLADKGYEAKKWWKEKQIAYPSVYGKAADDCLESVQGGHPCSMLIDDKGIIRGRWDAWSPGVAHMIKLAIWALKVVPEEGIEADIETVKQLIVQKEWAQALYLLEIMPEDADNAALRYKCLLEFDGRHAINYFPSIQKYKDSPEYHNIMQSIAHDILTSNSQDGEIIKNGIEAISTLFKSNNGRDYRLFESMGILRYRYAESYKKSSLYYLKQSIRQAQSQHADAATIERLEKQVKDYQSIIEAQK